MGNSHSLVIALQTVLQDRDLKVSTKTIEAFVLEVDRCAPWFICSGSLTLPSWQKLKGDLDREKQNGRLRACVIPIWKLVGSCLQDQKCEAMVKAGQKMLEDVRESLSETERSEKLEAWKKKKSSKTKVKVVSEAKDMPSEGKVKVPQETKLKLPGEDSLYPLNELEALELSSSDSEHGLPFSDEEELEEEAVRYEEGRYGLKSGAAAKKPKSSSFAVASTPPPYVEQKCGYSFCPPKTWRTIRQMFPVLRMMVFVLINPLAISKLKS